MSIIFYVFAPDSVLSRIKLNSILDILQRTQETPDP